MLGPRGLDGPGPGRGLRDRRQPRSLFEQADVLSLHLPGNRETRGIITADDLARMQPTALLVNTSRAPIIAEGALVAALRQGALAPRSTCTKKSRSSTRTIRCCKMPNALCTPHLGYAERGSYEALYNLAVDQLLAFAAGTPINVANPEAVGKR